MKTTTRLINSSKFTPAKIVNMLYLKKLRDDKAKAIVFYKSSSHGHSFITALNNSELSVVNMDLAQIKRIQAGTFDVLLVNIESYGLTCKTKLIESIKNVLSVVVTVDEWDDECVIYGAEHYVNKLGDLTTQLPDLRACPDCGVISDAITCECGHHFTLSASKDYKHWDAVIELPESDPNRARFEYAYAWLRGDDPRTVETHGVSLTGAIFGEPDNEPLSKQFKVRLEVRSLTTTDPDDYVKQLLSNEFEGV